MCGHARHPPLQRQNLAAVGTLRTLARLCRLRPHPQNRRHHRMAQEALPQPRLRPHIPKTGTLTRGKVVSSRLPASPVLLCSRVAHGWDFRVLHSNHHFHSPHLQ